MLVLIVAGTVAFKAAFEMGARVPVAPPRFARGFPKVERGALGVTVENITVETERQMALTSTTGALVTEVRHGSSADHGGVRAGDVILEIDHRAILQAADLQNVSRGLSNGSTVVVKVARQRRILLLTLDLS